MQLPADKLHSSYAVSRFNIASRRGPAFEDREHPQKGQINRRMPVDTEVFGEIGRHSPPPVRTFEDFSARWGV